MWIEMIERTDGCCKPIAVHDLLSADLLTMQADTLLDYSLCPLGGKSLRAPLLEGKLLHTHGRIDLRCWGTRNPPSSDIEKPNYS